jgi:FMN-dependent NADH-azoreductase
MNTLLIINSSPRRNSVSRRLTQHFAGEWKATHPDTRVIERDLAADTLPFVTESWIQASYTPPDQRTPEQQQALQLSDALIEELVAADVIVFGVPIHNFSIPASLKAWLDLIVRAGRTFSYSERGPKGLLPEGKQVVAYAEGSPVAAFDFQVPYLKKILGFIGLNDVIFVDADKQGLAAETAQQSIDNAVEKISALAVHLPSTTAVAA